MDLSHLIPPFCFAAQGAMTLPHPYGVITLLLHHAVPRWDNPRRLMKSLEADVIVCNLCYGLLNDYLYSLIYLAKDLDYSIV